MNRCALHFSCEQVESTSLSGVGRHKPLKLGRSGRFLSGTRTHMRVKKCAVITKTVRSNQSDTTKQHRRASSPLLAREGRSSDTLSLTTTSTDALHNMQHLTELSRQLYTCTQRSKVTLRGCRCLDQKDRWFERRGHVTYDGCRQPPTTHPEIFFQVGGGFTCHRRVTWSNKALCYSIFIRVLLLH